MQPNKDGDFDVAFQLQHKEMLQQLLTMLSSAIVRSPQVSVCPRRVNQPNGTLKKR